MVVLAVDETSMIGGTASPLVVMRLVDLGGPRVRAQVPAIAPDQTLVGVSSRSSSTTGGVNAQVISPRSRTSSAQAITTTPATAK